VNLSATQHPDLFYGAAGSFGTLGVTTLLEVSCIEAEAYVEMTYHPVYSVDDALSTLARECEDQTNDYIDGILFRSDRGVIVTGRLTNTPSPGVRHQRFTRAHDPWFYIHAERSTMNAKSPVKVITPVKDYLFRYDRGAFWVGIYAFKYFLTPFNRITRYLLDYFMHTRVMYHALHASGHGKQSIIQDLLLPLENAGKFLDWVFAGFEFTGWKGEPLKAAIAPLWLCPFKVEKDISFRPRHLTQEALAAKAGGDKEKKGKWFVNVGVWGPGSIRYEQFIQQNRNIEQKVKELGGLKWLYARAYYTEEEMWSIYDREWYDGLREKYHATYLPTVYEKVRVSLKTDDWNNGGQKGLFGSWRQALWQRPFSGLYGVFMTVWDREYLIAK
jgi:Delta24-sterol reductase